MVIAAAVDVHVGKKLKMARVLRDMTQYDLGTQVGVTLQQVQKYERGYNRISASRLFAIARVLGVKVGYFYEGLSLNSDTEEEGDGVLAGELAEDGKRFDFNGLNEREAVNVARLYLQVKNTNMKKILVNLIKAVIVEEAGEKQ